MIRDAKQHGQTRTGETRLGHTYKQMSPNGDYRLAASSLVREVGNLARWQQWRSLIETELR